MLELLNSAKWKREHIKSMQESSFKESEKCKFSMEWKDLDK